MKNLSYLVVDSSTNSAAIVDPTWDVDTILAEVSSQQCTLKSIWLTHTHYDHIQGLTECLTYQECPVYVHQNEAARVEVAQVVSIKDGDSIQLGNSNWLVTYTPGHSPGGVCFYSAPHLITGDTLFVNGCGRADIEGANPDALYDSLQRIKQFPESTIIYPGHHYARSKTDRLGTQFQKNRFLAVDNREAFISLRMG